MGLLGFLFIGGGVLLTLGITIFAKDTVKLSTKLTVFAIDVVVALIFSAMLGSGAGYALLILVPVIYLPIFATKQLEKSYKYSHKVMFSILGLRSGLFIIYAALVLANGGGNVMIVLMLTYMLIIGLILGLFYSKMVKEVGKKARAAHVGVLDTLITLAGLMLVFGSPDLDAKDFGLALILMLLIPVNWLFTPAMLMSQFVWKQTNKEFNKWAGLRLLIGLGGLVITGFAIF